MTVRLRYYLAILPLFLGLALINSLLVYFTERNEILWGLEQRGQGSAASIVGFWEVIAPGSDAQPSPELKRYGQRLGGLSISRFVPNANGWDEHPLLLTADVAAPPQPAGSAVAQLRAGAMAWSFIPFAGAAADLSVGYAPLLDGDGKLQAVIAVAERDTSLRQAIAALRLRLGALTLALLLAGLAAAELITRIAGRELQALTGAARDAAHGRYLTHWPAGRIRELNDLGGTLLTMTSLLADESHQTRRRFFQAEPLPSDADLAAGYRTHLEHALPETVGPTRSTYRRLGRLVPEDFCGWRETSAGWYLCVGRCAYDETDTPSLLQRMVRAEAAREFLLGVAVSRPSGPSWPEALKVFPCVLLQMVFIPASGRAPTGWTLDPARGIPMTWTPAKGRQVLGSLDAPALAIGQAYSKQFPDRPLDQIADELRGLLASRCQGLLVICDTPITPAAAGHS